MTVCHRCLLLLMLFCIGHSAPASEKKEPLVYRSGNLVFEWDLYQDKARVITAQTKAQVWQGSLLPAFWLSVDKTMHYVKASVIHDSSFADGKEYRLDLSLGIYGKGRLLILKEEQGIRFTELSIEWTKQAPAISEMYFGTSAVSLDSAGVWPIWDRPFMTDWQSFGFCVPGAKGGTPQSYFRMWDFGQANIALGNFGPSTGSPYGAAFPRPIYFASMGSDEGFVAIGSGSVPDAALSMRVQSTKGCFQYVYREDLWGAVPGKKRVWKAPLCIALGENPWAAFKNYYRFFPAKPATGVPAARAIWNTWGMWGQKKFIIRPIVDFAEKIGAETFVVDDPWEQSQGAGVPNLSKFPHFFDDLAYARDKKMDHGVWETVGWITDPFSKGLTEKDLILNRNGKPCKANWNFDPTGESYYCLDVSSERVRQFLTERTVRIMKTVNPSLIKLDFGYGMPAPNMGVPRNPAYRGERMATELIRLISKAAKSVNPNVVIMGYSISPLSIADIDLVSLDDQGDLWYEVARGHQEWSIWASLLSDKNIALSGSSGYKWEQDDEVVLNTGIIGSPGAVLPIYLKDEQPVPDKYLNRRLAIDKWYRKTISWTPLWLNSDFGDFTKPPRLNCWGRMEKAGQDSILTALALRDGDKEKLNNERITRLRWSGRWAVIAQDDKDIFSSAALAVIPFDPGQISLPYPARPGSISKLSLDGETAFPDWTWENGMLTIQLTEDQLNKTAGFLIKR